MAIYKISSTGALGTMPSVFTNVGSAFSSDSVAADQLTVDAGAFLIAADLTPGNAGAHLANTGAWTVNVNGIIVGADGITVASGNVDTASIAVGTVGTVSGSSTHGIAARSAVNVTNAGSITGMVNGISLEGNTANKITNSGSISGAAYAILDFGGSSRDTVSNTGLISGDVDLANGSNVLVNNGSMSGSVTTGTGNDYLKNTNSIFKQVALGAGTNTLINSGSIGDDGAGVSVLGGATGIDAVTNSGVLSASISLLAGTNTVSNLGQVGRDASFFSITGGNNNDAVSNSGTLLGAVNVSDGINSLTNSGRVGAIVAPGDPSTDGASYLGGSGADTVVNSGRLLGAVHSGGGANRITNYGRIGTDANGDSIVGGTGADAINNAARDGTRWLGGVIEGDVTTGDGNDSVSNVLNYTQKVKVNSVIKYKPVEVSGQIKGVVDLGAGNDKFTGGAYSETVLDGNGSDTYRLGGGNDAYIATGAGANLDGIDVIDGGTGALDSYDASGAVNAGIVINLDTNARSETGSGIGSVIIAANRAYGTDVAGQPPSNPAALYDSVTNFERVAGTQFADVIFGSAAANELAGNAGDDRLWGLGGNDLLNGGTGNDAIIGGTGADILAGGAGDDTFWFLSAADSGPAAAARDQIIDFAGGAGGDVIDLSRIDADTTVAGNNAFTFIGTNVAWTGDGGQLRAVWTTIGQVIEGDINGDKVADFAIAIIDVGHTIDLSNVNGVDFVL